jgi:hypothetical protein
MPYWDERVAEMAKNFPDVRVDKYHIDILTAHFVQHPDWFDVVVATAAARSRSALGDEQLNGPSRKRGHHHHCRERKEPCGEPRTDPEAHEARHEARCANGRDAGHHEGRGANADEKHVGEVEKSCHGNLPES